MIILHVVVINVVVISLQVVAILPVINAHRAGFKDHGHYKSKVFIYFIY